MKRREKLIRIVLTIILFALAACAFSVIWSQENVERFFAERGVKTRNAID